MNLVKMILIFFVIQSFAIPVQKFNGQLTNSFIVCSQQIINKESGSDMESLTIPLPVNFFLKVRNSFYGLLPNRDQFPNIKIISGYDRINTITKLIRPFKGKLVYVDLWASWCEPCIEDFAYSPDLYDSLSKRNIEMLYISIDSAESEWRKTIKAHKLSGYHIRASSLLKDDLSMAIWGAKGGYSIPHFLIFDRNGKLVSKDAHSPENKIDTLQLLWAYAVRHESKTSGHDHVRNTRRPKDYVTKVNCR